jgi:predicted exporter
MEKILEHMHRRRALYFGLLALFVAAAVLLASRTKLEANVLKLIMREDLSMGVLRVLEKNPLFESMHVDAWGADRQELKAFARALMKRVAAQKLAAPAAPALDDERIGATMAMLFDHRFYLTGLTGESAAEALGRDGMLEALGRSRMALLSLTAPVEKDRVARDPVDLFGLVEPRLKLAAGRTLLAREGDCFFSSAGMSEGMPEGLSKDMPGGMPEGLSKDMPGGMPGGDHCLVSFHPLAHPSDFEASNRLETALRSILDELASQKRFASVQTLVMGPHLFSAEGGRVVKRDVAVAFTVSSALVVLLFFLFFRRLAPVLVMVSVLGVAVAWGIAAAGLLTGRLHGITLGFASILLGIAIDYVIHVEAACSFGRREGESRAGAFRAVSRIFPSLLGGWITTSLIFLLLSLNPFPLVRQMGIVAVSGVTAAFIVSLLFLPHVPRRLRAGGMVSTVLSKLTETITKSRAVSAAILAPAAAAAVLSGLAAVHLTVDSNVENLEYRSPKLHSDLEIFRNRWHLMGRGDLVISRGSTLEQALQRNDRVFEILTEAQQRGAITSFMSLSPLLPSVDTQKKSLAAVQAARPLFRDAIHEASEAYGFDEAFFEPFFEDLEETRAGSPPPLRPGQVKGTFVESVLENAASREGGRAYVITSFIPRGSSDAVVSMLPQGDENVSWFNNRAFLGKIFRTLIREVTTTVLLSILVVLLYLLVTFRSVRLALISLLPLALSLPVTAALFALADIPLNALGVLALCLVIGLGIDYGLFMTNAVRGKTHAGEVGPAVLLSALTTLVAFGVLAFCRNPALSAVGKVVTAGITLNMVSALLLVPAGRGLLFGGRKTL